MQIRGRRIGPFIIAIKVPKLWRIVLDIRINKILEAKKLRSVVNSGQVCIVVTLVPGSSTSTRYWAVLSRVQSPNVTLNLALQLLPSCTCVLKY
jgi:hypothetical protein